MGKAGDKKEGGKGEKEQSVSKKSSERNLGQDGARGIRRITIGE